MKAKRIATLILALGLLIAGCGKSENTVGVTSQGGSEIVRESVERSGELLQFSIVERNKELSFVEGGHFADVSYSYPVLDKEDATLYPALFDAIDKAFSDSDNRIKEAVLSMINTYKERGFVDTYYFDVTDTTVLRADKTCVSVLQKWKNYVGAAHGDYAGFGYNFDTAEGRLLDFSDVVVDEDAFFEIVDEKLKAEYGQDYEMLIPLSEYRERIGKEGRSYNWTLEYDGVCIYFNPYEIGAYAYGAPIIKVSFDEADIFADKYKTVPDSYISPIKDDAAEYIDIDGDGVKDKVRLIKFETMDEYGNTVYKLSLRINEEDTDLEGIYNAASAYIAKDGEDLGVFISTVDVMSIPLMRIYDPQNNVFFESTLEASLEISFDEENLEEGYSSRDSVYRRAALTDPDYLSLSTDVFALGYYISNGIYTVDISNKAFIPKSKAMVPTVAIILQARRDINCEITDGSGNITGTGKIPKDMYLMIDSTDGATFAMLREIKESIVETMEIGTEDYKYLYTLDPNPQPVESNVMYRVKLSEGNGYLKEVDGTSEEEAFYGVLYAG